MYPFISARWFTPTKSRVIDLIVIHSMEAPEGPNTAENVARYFSRLPSTSKASAHYCVDNDSIVQCVQDKDVAYAAPGANHNGLQIELAGYARQSAEEWSDGFSDAMLRRAAKLVADKAREYGIQIRFRNAAQLRNGGPELRGITTHHEVSQAYRRSDHYDPGKGFPMEKFLTYVRAAGGFTSPQEAKKVMAGYPHATDALLVPGYTTKDGHPGAWIVASDGGVFSHPDKADPPVPFYGSMGGKPLNAPVCSIVGNGTADGYYLIGEDGGIFTFGNVPVIMPYARFGEEYAAGLHKMIHAAWVGSGIMMVASDGATYYREPGMGQ